MVKEEVIEVSELDLVVENADRIEALVDLLIEKKIITKKEYEERVLEFNEEIE